jgi:hypothetical protein
VYTGAKQDAANRRDQAIQRAYAALEQQRQQRAELKKKQEKCACRLPLPRCIRAAAAYPCPQQALQRGGEGGACARPPAPPCPLHLRPASGQCRAQHRPRTGAAPPSVRPPAPRRSAQERQWELEQRKRREIEAAKRAELAAERSALHSWREGLPAGGGDAGAAGNETDYEDEAAAAADAAAAGQAMPDHPAYYGRGRWGASSPARCAAAAAAAAAAARQHGACAVPRAEGRGQRQAAAPAVRRGCVLDQHDWQDQPAGRWRQWCCTCTGSRSSRRG